MVLKIQAVITHISFHIGVLDFTSLWVSFIHFTPLTPYWTTYQQYCQKKSQLCPSGNTFRHWFVYPILMWNTITGWIMFSVYPSVGRAKFIIYVQRMYIYFCTAHGGRRWGWMVVTHSAGLWYRRTWCTSWGLRVVRFRQKYDFNRRILVTRQICWLTTF